VRSGSWSRRVVALAVIVGRVPGLASSSVSPRTRCVVGCSVSEIDSGVRPGATTDDATRLLELEREVKELRRANAILRSASAFFAAELDRPHSR